MSTYKELARSVDTGHKELMALAKEPMTAFSTLYRAASAEGAFDKKTKELISLAIAVATHCQGCIAVHARAAARHGASEAEVIDVLMVAVEMSGGPGTVYAGNALQAFREFS